MERLAEINDALLDNVTVVIRSANERTTEICYKLALSEVRKENIFIIEEKPFFKAVKKTFEIGVNNNKKWTLALDADLILLPNAISLMIKNANNYGNELYVYQGNIFDNFKKGIKYGGPHLYLTKNVENVSQFYEQIENLLRPESFLYRQMKNLGFKIILENKLFALHDFFQYYKDIYRKSFFHGVKHPKWNSLIPNWIEKAKFDDDYKVTMQGFIDGYMSDKEVYPSIDFLDNRFCNKIISLYDLAEKDKIEFIDTHEVLNVLIKHNIHISNELEILKTNDPKKKIIGLLKYLRR